jgi:hypothetical protein
MSRREGAVTMRTHQFPCGLKLSQRPTDAPIFPPPKGARDNFKAEYDDVAPVPTLLR